MVAAPVYSPANSPGSGRGPVEGYIATQSAAGTKTDTPIIETPQSISVVGKEQIQAQGAQTVNEVLRYVPGVQADSNAFDSRATLFRIRGFDQSVTGLFQDGLRLYNFNNQAGIVVEPYSVERVDVLRGPSSVLYGQSDPGGMVNLISKLPTSTPFNEARVQGGSFGRIEGAFDFSGPINKEKTILYRFTGLARESGDSIDLTKDNRYFLQPSVTFQPDASTSWTLLATAQRDQLGSTFNILPRIGTLLPAAYGFLPMNWTVNGASDYFTRTRYSLTSIFEHRFDNGVTVRQNIRHLQQSADYQESGFAGLQADNITANRFVLGGADSIKNTAFDTQAEYLLDWGGVKQRFLVGVDMQYLSSNVSQGFSGATSTNLLNPSRDLGPRLFAPSSAPISALSQAGVYFQDQIKILDRLVITAGGRQDWASTDNADRINGTSTSQDDAKWTSRIGAVFLADYGFAPYASYAESFLPQVGATFSGTGLRPATGNQYEGGLKWQPTWFKGLFTVAYFDITQQNVLTTDLAHIGFSVQTGEVHSTGVEFEVKAEITKGLNLIASYTHINPIVTQSNDGNVGNVLNQVSRDLASLWVDYEADHGWLNGWRFAAGARYVGPSFGDAANTIAVPGYTLYDAMIGLKLAALNPQLKGWTAAVNGTNLLNTRYVAQCGYFADACRYGYGRRVIGSLRYNW